MLMELKSHLEFGYDALVSGYSRILPLTLANRSNLGHMLQLTMATLRPNWFLISPVLIASGAFSLMTW